MAPMHTLRLFIQNYYSSISAFLFFSLGLFIHDGFLLGSVLLFLAGIPFLFKKSTYKSLNRKDLILIGSLLFFSGIWIINTAYFSLPLRAYDDPVRFIAAITALLFLLRHQPKESFVWAGICVGALAIGGLAFWEKIQLQSLRVNGHTNAIQFGNLAILFGILCLIGIGWASHQTRFKKTWIIFLTFGFICGVCASALSGSRGGWLGFALIIMYITAHFKGILSKKTIVAILFFIPTLVISLYLSPHTQIQNRIDQIWADLHLYSQGTTQTSIGTRIELWRGSIEMIQEKPIWGWGEAGYKEKLQELITNGAIKPAILSHSHNDFLNVLSHRGIVGGISLLLLYIAPIILFYRSEKNLFNNTQIPLAITGPVIAISYIDFGLTQSFFAHNNGVMFFAFSIVILYSTLKRKPYQLESQQSFQSSQSNQITITHA